MTKKNEEAPVAAEAPPKEKSEPQPVPTVSAGSALDMVPVRIGGGDLLDPDEVTPEALEALGRRAEFFEKAVRMALLWTEPDQYVIHKSEDGKTSTVYPMGRAGLALLKFFGMKFAVPMPVANAAGAVVGYQPGPQECLGQVQEVKQESDKGDKVVRYMCVTSALWLTTGRCVALTEGKRAIGSGYSRDEVQARQCAMQNMASRAARLVLGLGISPEWFTARGVDLSRAKVVEFQDRSGGASSDPEQAVIRWGKAKGTKVRDLSDEDLRFYTERQEKDAADPEKAKFKPERLLAALKAEAERRAAKPTMDAESAEEFDRTIVALREEMTAQRVNQGKLDAYVATLQTLEQARKALEHYRGKRVKKSAAPAVP